MTTPDQLAHDIEGTQDSPRGHVDKLNDTVSPSKAVGRRMDRLKNGAGSIREKVMGYADNSDGHITDALQSAKSSVQQATDAAAGKVGDSTGSAPQAVREQASGNPLAAGVIAFGVGWLLSALVPAGEAEQRAAKHAEEHSGAVIDPLKASASEVASNLSQPLKDSAQSVQRTATDAATRTADQAKDAATTTADHARSAADDVQSSSPLTS